MAGSDADRVAISVIGAKESAFISAVGRYFPSGQTEEPLGDLFVIYFFIVMQGVKITVNLLYNPVSLEEGAGDEQRILEIHLILFIITVIGKFRISGQCKISCCFEQFFTVRAQTSYVSPRGT